MTPLFGEFQVRVDPWEVDYGSETPLAPIADQPDEDVALEVELPLARWAPLRPGSVSTPSRLCFIDGVRRLESRLVVRRNGDILHGGFGSFAVGYVEVRPGQASFGETKLRPRREVVLGSGACLPHAVPVRTNLVYEPRSAEETEPD